MDKQIKSSIGYVIQARMKSQRLQGKVLMPLPFPDGKPILTHIVDVLEPLEGDIIVATSRNKENDKIETFCQTNGIGCLRGDEDNVLSRFLAIQEVYAFSHIVRLTADNPFIDSTVIQDVIDFHIAEDNDYTCSKGLPLGMNIEVFKGSAIADSQKYILNRQDEEHVTLVLKRENQYRKGNYIVDEKLAYHRLTVDTVQDFLVASILMQLKNTTNLQGVELIKYAKKYCPWVFMGNADIIQKNSEQNVEKELQDAIYLLGQLEYFNAAEILKSSIDKLK